MSQVVIKLISFLFSSDVSSYYQDIYRKKFCLSSNQGTNTTIKTEKLSWNEQTDMGYSSQQQNFGIDFEELEGEFRICVPKEQATDCQNDEKQLFLEKENKGYGTDKNSLLCKSHNSKSNFQRYVSTTAHNVTSLGDKRQLFLAVCLVLFKKAVIQTVLLTSTEKHILVLVSEFIIAKVC